MNNIHNSRSNIVKQGMMRAINRVENTQIKNIINIIYLLIQYFKIFYTPIFRTPLGRGRLIINGSFLSKLFLSNKISIHYIFRYTNKRFISRV